MQELIAQLPIISGIVEKGGIIGLLLLIMAVLIWERTRLVKELTSTYRDRDKNRLGFVICKGACDANNIKVDLTPLVEFAAVTA